MAYTVVMPNFTRECDRNTLYGGVLQQKTRSRFRIRNNLAMRG